MTWGEPPSGGPSWGGPPPNPPGAPPPYLPSQTRTIAPPRRRTSPVVVGLLVLSIVALVAVGAFAWSERSRAERNERALVALGVDPDDVSDDGSVATTTVAPPGGGVVDGSNACDNQLRTVATAVKAWAAQHGDYPMSLAEIAGSGGFLESVPSDLTYAPTGDPAAPFVLTGTGPCAGHDLNG